jgi:hypothetical protein
MTRFSLIVAAAVLGLGSLAHAAEEPHLCPATGHVAAEQPLVAVAIERARPAPIGAVAPASRRLAPTDRPT